MKNIDIVETFRFLEKDNTFNSFKLKPVKECSDLEFVISASQIVQV